MNQGIGVLSSYVKSAVQLHPKVGGDQSLRPVAKDDPFADSVRLSISATGRTLAGIGSDAAYQGPSDPLALARGRSSAQQTLAPMRQGGEMFQQNANRLQQSTQERQTELESAPKNEKSAAPRIEPREPAPTPRGELIPEVPRREKAPGERVGLIPAIPEAQPRPLTTPQIPRQEIPEPKGSGIFNALNQPARGLSETLVKKPEPEKAPELKETNLGVGGNRPQGGLGQPPGAVRQPEETPGAPGLNRPVFPPREEEFPPEFEPSQTTTPPPSTSTGENRTQPNASDVAISRAAQVSALRTYSQVAGFGAQNDASQGTPFARVA